MTSKLTLLGYALLAWAGVAAASALALRDTRFTVTLVAVALSAATGGLVLTIIGAARHDSY